MSYDDDMYAGMTEAQREAAEKQHREEQDRFARLVDLMEVIEKDAYAEMERRLADAMREVGEDPANPALRRLRMVQMAYSINSRANREAAK